LLNQLLERGYTVQSVTVDGKRGLYRVFAEYPTQMCIFHQKRIVQRYITMRPRLQARKDLKKIVATLTTTTEKRFMTKLDQWYEEYADFIDEKTISFTSGKEFFTHYKVRAAYRSLRRNLPYLFTSKNNPKPSIHTTTNTLEGGTFSPMKTLIKIHRGLSKSLKLKIVDDYLVNHKKK